MKKVSVVVTIATIFVFLIQTTPFIGVANEIIFGMFSLVPFVIIYMVYVILKYGKSSPHTFEERFYDDWDYKRNVVKKD